MTGISEKKWITYSSVALIIGIALCMCNLLALVSFEYITIPFCLICGGILAGINISEKNTVPLIISMVVIITPYIFPTILFMLSGMLGIPLAP